jgi:hypothetical protein
LRPISPTNPPPDGTNKHNPSPRKTSVEQCRVLSMKRLRVGGIRYWFLCPAVKDTVYCGNRVTKLFLPPGGSVFGCRQCYDLTYQSCQESHKYDKVFGHIENADVDSLSVTQALRLGGL